MAANMSKVKLLTIALFINLFGLMSIGYANAQAADISYYLHTLPKEGVQLDQGWKFHAGDNPEWAHPHYDDSAWQPVNPTDEIETITPLREAQIGWFRLRIKPDSAFVNKPLSLLVTQRGASEFYLDGHLFRKLGKVSTDPEVEVVYDPNNLPLPILLPNKAEVVIAVRYSFTRENYRYIFSRWYGNNCLVIRLQEAGNATEALVVKRSYVAFREFAKVGYFLALGLLHLLLFIFYPSRRTNLYYSIGIISLSVHFLLYYIGSFLPQEGRLFFIRQSLANLLQAQAFLWLLLVVYAVARERVGVVYWITGVFMVLCVKFTVLLPVYVFLYAGDAIRVSWHGLGRGIPDLKLSMIGWAGFIGLIVGFYLFYFRILPPSQLGLDFFFNGAIIWLTFLFSLLLAREYARTNSSLHQKLEEVKALSDKTIAQEKEKQQLLATENERLDEQIRERTEELRQQNNTLARQAEKLQEQDQLKTRFITNLTHEFRTPLSLILSPVEKLINEPTIPAEFQPLLSVVKRNAHQLLSLINQLLDLSKLEAGHMTEAQVQTNPEKLLESLLTLFRPQAESKKIELLWFNETDDSCWLIDPDKWNKILTNLMSNAVKYTPEGGKIAVRFRIEKDQALIVISDTGIGISTEKLPYIFDRFYQVDDSTTRTYEGSGIGLALVKELTDLLGVSIEVESKLHEGTTCRLTLPLHQPNEEKELFLQAPDAINMLDNKQLYSENNKPWPELRKEKPMVLVVEDNLDLRTFISEELAKHYRVLTAANGVEAWDIVRHELPDLVVSDVMMPLRDGFALTQLIKTDSVTSHIAVVLLTARTSQESCLEGLTHGADDYLTKPFWGEELQLRLRNLLKRREQLQAHFRQQLCLTIRLAETEPAQDTFLTHLYELLEAHLDDSTYGVEALALEVGMSRRTLYRKITALTNLSVHELMHQFRLRRATDLLRQGHNVSETAYLVGFESPAHFTATFKTFYQQTPSKFLAQWAATTQIR